MENTKKKILIYAHYYYPDVASTGQILQELAEGISDRFDVTVICTVPSYTGKVDDEYKGKKFFFEELNGVHIVRVSVPEFTKGNKLSRVKNILAYFFNARKATKKLGNFDYIFTISQPPILGGMLGVYGKKKKRAKLIYNIQDFNPEQIAAVGYSGNKLLLRVMLWLDKRSCRKSDLIVTVGRDLVETVNKRFEGKRVPKTVMITNWMNDKQVYPLPADDKGVLEFKQKYGLQNKFVIMYSGNIGLYYDLENLIKVIGKVKPGTCAADGREVIFAFVGAGSVLANLQEYVSENQMTNVVFIPYQDKDKIIYSLNAADVHLCVNAKGIKGVSCPSKFYGIAAVAKPVLAVLEEGTEIRMIIEESHCGLVSAPGDYSAFESNLLQIISSSSQMNDEFGKNGYKYFKTNLTMQHSVEQYIEQIVKL